MNRNPCPDEFWFKILASQAGVPMSLNIRGLCSLRAGVPGLSQTIRVYSILGRFLEHSRIYRFENGGEPIFLIGSADWMKRNLDRRMETIVPVLSPEIKAELEEIFTVYERDNTFSWDMQNSGCRLSRIALFNLSISLPVNLAAHQLAN